MQHVLSKIEYHDLVEHNKRLDEKLVDDLQTACTMVAISMPIKFWGRDEATPWDALVQKLILTITTKYVMNAQLRIYAHMNTKIGASNVYIK